MTPTDIANSATVTRWHSANCMRYPSIAEHSYLVTMHANGIMKKVWPDAPNDEVLKLLQYCLWHDLPEVFTGDMPTPIKRWLEAESPLGASPLDKMEEVICPEYKERKLAIESSPSSIISKLADILDAMHFIYIEGKGSKRLHIFKERKLAYQELVTMGMNKYPELSFDLAIEYMNELMSGNDTVIVFSEFLNKP